MNGTLDKTMQPIHPIQVVVRRTGLSADVIRAWERRYEAVSPQRSPTSRRLYSEEDVERLLLLREATQTGRRIGDVAHLSLPDLKKLLAADIKTAPRVDEQAIVVNDIPRSARGYVQSCLRAVHDLDGQALDSALAEASLVLTTPVLLEEVVTPLLQQVGNEWRAGQLRPCHEHLATAELRSFLGNLVTHTNMTGTGPAVLITTPRGQRHELGALMVAVTFAFGGWNPLYLGPDIPSDEIAFAAVAKQIKVVAISISYPADDPRLPEALRRLRRQLPQDIVLLVGGAAVIGYRQVLEEIGAQHVPDLPTLRNRVDQLRINIQS
jgi:DNA-binding transcriptional MerR regulator/methylmalonyl-CoA mutase cobalamin-binding subunit